MLNNWHNPFSLFLLGLPGTENWLESKQNMNSISDLYSMQLTTMLFTILKGYFSYAYYVVILYYGTGIPSSLVRPDAT